MQSDPEQVSVDPAIASALVTLPDAGFLPAAPEGTTVAWFGEPATGTYCGSDFASIKQTPEDGCTSTQRLAGGLSSPPFSLAGATSAYLVFRGWWEIEAVNADIADLMQIQYSVDGGATWALAGTLNPLDPAWGGRHQVFSNTGARSSAGWQPYTVDLTAAAGQPDVRIRFAFDTVDTMRNGFRGLLVDGVAIVDGLGETLSDPGAGPFTDAPPALTVAGVTLSQTPAGNWVVELVIEASHPSTHSVGVDWSVQGSSAAEVATGHATLAPGTTSTTLTVPVSGADAPYTVALSNPDGASIPPGGGESTTPGGSVPLVGLDGVSAAAAPDGQVAVTLAASLSAPTTLPVFVDYVLEGSDGVPGPGGTLTIAPGTLATSTTVLAPAAHAPYTVGLSNARNAILDPARATTGTSPVVATTAVAASASLGTQLILGVRASGGIEPDLGRTFLLTGLSGTVRYHRPGDPYLTLPPGTVELPLGTVVDATRGHAQISLETDRKGTVHTGEFWAGKFGVFQAATDPAPAELRLAGGDFAACPGISRKRARKSAKKSVRQLWGSAKGRFRTRGRFAAATIRGTKWLTEDLCLSTRVTVQEGVVEVLDFRRKRSRLVRAGSSVTIGALQSARYRKRRGVHAPRLSAAPRERR